ncbi:MAG: hypothetical protein FWC78_07990 [Defluviitaleaceae bacterium]|nr:hypothetical protein [Defluviitaleaceae bacterium]
MKEVSTNLPTYFGLPGRGAKDRGGYICKAEGGLVRIFKTNDSPTVIGKRYGLLQGLAAAGLVNIDKIYLSRHGQPYINLGRDTYVMMQLVRGRELDFNSREEVKTVVQALAGFHKAARGKGFGLPVAAPIPEVWRKENISLTQALKQAQRSSKLSDFDVLVIKNAPMYIDAAVASAEALAATDYIALQRDAISQGAICHNIIKEENLLITAAGCFITNFVDSSYDLQLVDLAGFIRRYIKHSNRIISIGGIAEIYDEISPLPGTAQDILRALLAYPWPFAKIVKEYYSKKRGWTPIGTMSRLVSVLEEQPIIEKYLKA